MRSIQTAKELDTYYVSPDPWGYYQNKHDAARKSILLEAIKAYAFGRALDIGCGNGFLTESFPATEIIGIDISSEAIVEAKSRSRNKHISYVAASLFELPNLDLGAFDCVLITGVLYEQYIGNAHPLVYKIVDGLLAEGGILVSVHIDDWYFARFPYSLTNKRTYRYRSYRHLLEIYRK